MAVTMESAVFMGKNHQNNCHSNVYATDLTLKQMFDISTKLVSEQDEISRVDTIGWERHSWKYLSLIGDERIINLQRTKVYVFSDSVLCLGKILQNPESNEAWKKRIEWITTSQSYRNFDGNRCTAQLVNNQEEINCLDKILWGKNSWKRLSLIGDEQVISLQRTKVYVFSDSVLCFGKMSENPRSNIAWEERLAWFKSSQEDSNLDRIDGEPIEFEWNIFPGFTTLQFSQEVQELLLRLNETPENFTGRIIFMSMFNDISWGSRDNTRECESHAQLVSL